MIDTNPCDEGWELAILPGGNGKCIQLQSTKVAALDQAKDFCESRQSELLQIESVTESLWLLAYIKRLKSSTTLSEAYWIANPGNSSSLNYFGKKVRKGAFGGKCLGLLSSSSFPRFFINDAEEGDWISLPCDNLSAGLSPICSKRLATSSRLEYPTCQKNDNSILFGASCYSVLPMLHMPYSQAEPICKGAFANSSVISSAKHGSDVTSFISYLLSLKSISESVWVDINSTTSCSTISSKSILPAPTDCSAVNILTACYSNWVPPDPETYETEDPEMTTLSAVSSTTITTTTTTTPPSTTSIKIASTASPTPTTPTTAKTTQQTKSTPRESKVPMPPNNFADNEIQDSPDTSTSVERAESPFSGGDPHKLPVALIVTFFSIAGLVIVIVTIYCMALDKESRRRRGQYSTGSNGQTHHLVENGHYRNGCLRNGSSNGNGHGNLNGITIAGTQMTGHIPDHESEPMIALPRPVKNGSERVLY